MIAGRSALMKYQRSDFCKSACKIDHPNLLPTRIYKPPQLVFVADKGEFIGELVVILLVGTFGVAHFEDFHLAFIEGHFVGNGF